MDCEAYIVRWTSREGGAERANVQMYLSEFCDVIGMARPDPAGFEHKYNDYVFERAVRRRESDAIASSLRIDLYKRGCFILEAKQSRLPGGYKALPNVQPEWREQRAGTGDTWDAALRAGRRQAEHYVFLLEPDHVAPQFLIICDVGNVFELYADFTGTGRGYTQFPDRNSFRIHLADLRKPQVRELFAKIWDDPASLDPARVSARVTASVARRLAAVSRSLEARYDPGDVAFFLMRSIFCMFAEDVDLLPKDKFTQMLTDCTGSPGTLLTLLQELWSKMDNADRTQRYFAYFGESIRHFNGKLYRDARVLLLTSEEITELAAAARHNWIDVDPAIFGTLLEQALDPVERRKLGAHYTPRAFVERLVERTIMDVLRAEWRAVLKQAEDAKELGDVKKARLLVWDFQKRLCKVTVLDPACGTGNFLYVALEMMKKLEGDVLETLTSLGGNELLGLDDETVWPRQFLGLEKNPRAAAIAELVIWIGYLQQHYRTKSGHPQEPILRAFDNINYGRRDGFDAILSGYDDLRAGSVGLAGPLRPDWPDAEFIVGNPPFLGGKDLRSRLGDAYAQALWAAHPHINRSADLVMYWWDRAAELLTRKGTKLKRFGLVTTNSISQVFQRRVMERHLGGDAPISLVFAIPDHPWTKATKDAASVRIAMTVTEKGRLEGELCEVVSEVGLDTDDPMIVSRKQMGAINSDLSIGASPSASPKLIANSGISSRGVVLHGAGFMVPGSQMRELGVGTRDGIERHICRYRNGKDITHRSREMLVLDLYPLSPETIRLRFPEVYQHLLETVKPYREQNNMPFRRDNWCWFGATHEMYRDFTKGLRRYIATAETAKHRVFVFLDGDICADNKLVAIGSDDAFHLAVLSSNIHVRWALASGGWLGVGNDPCYSKSRCFDPFPFPDPPSHRRQQLRDAGEELDALRKSVLEEHNDLTLTGLYNVLEKLKAGAGLSAKEEDVKQRGFVLILKELHETIDALTADAYGWAHNLTEQEVLTRLVALNLERHREEESGRVRWLRPDFQISRFAKASENRTEELGLERPVISIDRGKPFFPKDRHEQPLAVEALLSANGGAHDAQAIARLFRGGGARIEPRVQQILVTLARYGHISPLADGRFVARLAA
jgi:hypothetical protein